MPAAPVPMVLLVHGGPWLRDDLAFDPQHAWLADRGYAVLSVNFRASGGFGSDFMAKGDRKWSETMHDDLLDGVKRSEEHTSELQSLMRISYAVFCLTKKKHHKITRRNHD